MLLYFSYSGALPCETLLQQKQTLSAVSLRNQNSTGAKPQRRLHATKSRSDNTSAPSVNASRLAAAPSRGGREVSRLRLSAPSSRSALGLLRPLRELKPQQATRNP